MSFGSVFSAIGTKMGMDPLTANILGSGFDASSDYLAQSQDRAQLEAIYSCLLYTLTLPTTPYV